MLHTQFYKNGYQDWFVEMENKMTPEQKQQSLAMMEGMKKRMVESIRRSIPQKAEFVK